jgi:fermentation-respiration switch protein FrsA (DUF1100 family)
MYKIKGTLALTRGVQHQSLAVTGRMRAASRSAATVVAEGVTGRVAFRPPLSLTARSQTVHGTISSAGLGVSGPINGSLTRSGAHYTFRGSGSGTIKSGPMAGVKWKLTVTGTK